MIDNFPWAIRFTLVEEGGNVDDEDDPGGRTSRGVTQRTWDETCKLLKWPSCDVWVAPQARIITLYRLRYWRKIGADFLTRPLCLAAFDTSVLHGTGQARHWLGECGGDWAAYIGLREASYDAIIQRRPKSEKYRRTWMGRCARLRLACSAVPATAAAAA